MLSLNPNARLLNYLKFGGLILFWLPITFFSLLLFKNTLPYFDFSSDYPFITERAHYFKDTIYYTCFYVHLAAGIFCIAAALLQFSSEILRSRKKIHIWSGRIYVFAVLLLGAPTGMYMSFFAKGSAYEKGMFMFMAVAWFYTTLKGLTTILNKKVIAHKNWMYRSYALALTAVTFRILHIILYMMDWGSQQNYEISLWISVLGNILVTEIIIFRNNKNYLKTIIT